MMRSFGPTLALAAALTIFMATPAAADDLRRHVMTPLQKIDLVRDLPEEPAFEKDGQYFDLGYIYSIRTVNGASVASSDGESGYVLYHDDKYVKVDAVTMDDLRYALGDDPTQGYTPPTSRASRSGAAAADPWGANGSADDARGQPLTATPGRSARRGGSIIATVCVMFLLLFLRSRAFRDMVIGGVLAGIAAIARRSDRSNIGPATGPIEDKSAQAAAQRARLDALSGTSSTPTAGGFGRKVA